MKTAAASDAGAWTLPNLLTLMRVIAAPLVPVTFVLLDRPMADLVAFVLFSIAGITDFLDGWLARRWGQTSAVGRMMDPIADKAMVISAVAVVLALRGPDWAVMLPAAAILLRETFVSGLRESLAGRAVIHVTRLAKWKTTAQMGALGLLLLAGYAEIRHRALYMRLPPDAYDAMLSGAAPDVWATGFWADVTPMLEGAGLALFWVAGALTLITGWDYLRKGLAVLRKEEN
ncbi:MAG: CDP-diacylglycerol--glycerol-3-phosphate 3-phosphatidyltransferase [Paracoccaceae bacterium]|jgi:CDP-diacylglycerol--glycerol-3-phosphate 3-phosphatidyltransferase